MQFCVYSGDDTSGCLLNFKTFWVVLHFDTASIHPFHILDTFCWHHLYAWLINSCVNKSVWNRQLQQEKRRRKKVFIMKTVIYVDTVGYLTPQGKYVRFCQNPALSCLDLLTLNTSFLWWHGPTGYKLQDWSKRPRIFIQIRTFFLQLLQAVGRAWINFVLLNTGFACIFRTIQWSFKIHRDETSQFGSYALFTL